MRGLPSILPFFSLILINSIKQEHECSFFLSYEIKISLKSHFSRKNAIMYATSLRTSFHTCNVTPKSVNY